MKSIFIPFFTSLIISVTATKQFLDVFRTLSKDFNSVLPSENSHYNVSSDCLRQVSSVYTGSNQLELWALKVIDASAKLPSGILQGNLNQLGDYDLCLSAVGYQNGDKIQGKYCLAEISIEFKYNKELNEMIHAYRVLTSNITDPGQRIPKLNSWRWGVCLPSACTTIDLKNHLEHNLKAYLAPVANIDVQVNSDVCYTARPKDQRTFGFYLTTFILGVIGVLIVCGTTGLQFFNKTMAKYLDCFSLKRNWVDLWNTESNPDEIDVVHGARILSALGLLMAHKQVAQLYHPFTNAVSVANTLDGGWTMLGRAAILYTDTFIILSGLLTARNLLKELQTKGNINIKKHIITRYLRFTPNLLVVILISTYLIDDLGSGPQWGQVVSKYSGICKQNMWRNFLYIHNFYGFEEMCLTHTHQLGLDMQLFLISPILITFLWKYPKIGTITIAILAGISTWLRYTVTLREELSTIVYYGISVDQLFKTARFSYILPTHRFTIYAFGIILGYCYRNKQIKFNIKNWFACFGWFCALSFGFIAVFGLYDMGKRSYVYNAKEAAIYHAFSPFLWGSFVAWIAVSCYNGKGGWFHTMLSWKYYNVFSRISYAVYLVQFPVFFYNVGIQRTALHYKGFFEIIEISEFLAIFFLSVCLTLLVDMPFQNLRKIIYERKPKTDVNEKEEKLLQNNGSVVRNERKIKFG